MRRDDGGEFWDTFFDVVSLAMSVVDVIANPSDAWAWAGLAGDTVDVLVPFLSGVGEATDAMRIADKAEDIVDAIDDVYDSARVAEASKTIRNGVRIQKATDLTPEALNIIRSLDHTGGITRSSASAGRKIHAGYKTNYEGVAGMIKEATIGRNRIDFLDVNNKIIYELKPNNPRSIKQGMQQLKRYNDALGGGFTLILELY